MYEEKLGPLEKRLQTLRTLLYQTMESKRESFEEEFGDLDMDDEDPFAFKDRIGDDEDFPSAGQNGHKLSPKLEEQVRKLFRELAKRFHPDLTADPEEKSWREEVMAKINQAYAKRDLQALQALAEQPDRALLEDKAQTREEELKTIKTEIKRLDGVINELKATIAWLEDSSAMKLKLQVRAGGNADKILALQANSLIEQIADLEEHLIVQGVAIEAIHGQGAVNGHANGKAANGRKAYSNGHEEEIDDDGFTEFEEKEPEEEESEGLD
jgi:curved DNA-binding protein CbpA